METVQLPSLGFVPNYSPTSNKRACLFPLPGVLVWSCCVTVLGYKILTQMSQKLYVLILVLF